MPRLAACGHSRSRQTPKSALASAIAAGVINGCVPPSACAGTAGSGATPVVRLRRNAVSGSAACWATAGAQALDQLRAGKRIGRQPDLELRLIYRRAGSCAHRAVDLSVIEAMRTQQ